MNSLSFGRSTALRQERKSTYSGSLLNAPRSVCGSAVVRVQSKSEVESSHAMSPSIRTMSIFAGSFRSIHRPSSLCTHFDCAPAGEARKRRNSESSSADSILGQRPGAIDRFVRSRKMRNERIRYHGLANRSSDRCSAEGSVGSPAWL